LGINIKLINDFISFCSVEETEKFILRHFKELTCSSDVIVLSIGNKKIQIYNKDKTFKQTNRINILEFEKLFSKKNFIVETENSLVKFNHLQNKTKTIYIPLVINQILKKIIVLIEPKCSEDIIKLLATVTETIGERISLKGAYSKKDYYFNEIFRKINLLIIIIDKNFNILFSNKNKNDIYKCFDLAFGYNAPCSFCPLKQKEITKEINNCFFRIRQEEVENKKLCIIEDITKIISLKKELDKAEKLSFLGKISSEITHEIKNPLNAMQLKITLLENILKKDNLLNETTDKIIAGVKYEITRLTNIANDFLQMGGDYKLNKTVFSIKDLIEELIGDTAEKALKARIQVEFLCGEFAKCNIHADRDKLKQAFLNLINNAIEELKERKPKSPQITIMLDISHNLWQIDFIDNGLGVKDESALFTPFFTTKPHGTGLGLSISHKTISAHKGTMEYFRKDNKTFFRIKLPKSVDN
jgi:nitrogen-specific signal transduction histidine kinase